MKDDVKLHILLYCGVRSEAIMSALVLSFLQREGPVATVVLGVGLLVVASFVHTFLYGIYARLLRPGKNLKKVYGSWGKLINFIFLACI